MALSPGPYFEGRIERLVKNDILPPLEFSDIEKCIDCIKGKYVKKIKKRCQSKHSDTRNHSHRYLWTISYEIVDGYNLFITFIDGYSRYGYIYPIKERSEAFDKFKIFKAKVKNQHDKRIKVVRSYHGGGVLWSAHSIWPSP
jgi:hypothetical protein